MYFWCYHIFLAHALNKPVYVMPNSFGPFEGPFVKQIAKAALKRCSLVTSRESLSTQMVFDKLNIKISTYPDLAFNLPMSELEKEEVFDRFDLPSDRELVALTMRPYRFPKSENPSEAYKRFK